MIESLLQEATDALLAQQDEIRRLHRIIAWCRYRVAPGEARQVDTMVRSCSAKLSGTDATMSPHLTNGTALPKRTRACS